MVMGRFKMNHNLSYLGRHPLGSANVEGHILPAPVVYKEFDGRIGLGGGFGIYPIFFPVTFHPFASNLRSEVLPPDGILVKGFFIFHNPE